MARTDGARIILEDGRELIDGIASWWTACHGYNHPHIRAAVQAQLERAPHVMFGGLAHEPAYRLAARLAALLPGDLDHVFFAESGSVSVEIAMKMAMQYWINRGVARPHPLRRLPRRLSRRHLGDDDRSAIPKRACTACSPACCRPSTSSPCPATTPRRAALDALLDDAADEIAAIVVEPRVQGAGGMLFHDDEVLRRLRRARRPHTTCC